MKKLLGLFVLLFVFIPRAAAQQTPAWDVEGSYLFRSFYVPNSGARVSMNGWDFSLDHNIRRWIGVVVDVNGTYSNQGVNGKTQIYTFMIGPRIYFLGHRHKIVPYGQLLFGGGYDHLTFPLNAGFPKTTFTSGDFAWGGGIGLELKVKQKWALRLMEFDYEQTRFTNYSNQAMNTQGNYRISVGIVYHIGEK